MKGTEKYVESRQLHKEGYSQEGRLEIESNGKVQSISLTPNKTQDGRNAYEGMILESILERQNLNEAFKRVKRNKGSHGIDNMTVDELQQYLSEHGAELRESILSGTYVPKPVRRVEIPKDNGKKRQSLVFIKFAYVFLLKP